MPRVRVSPLGPKCYKSLLRFIAFLFVWSETRKIKCGADERRRRGLDRADPLSAPTGADANESRHSGRNRQFSVRKLAVLANAVLVMNQLMLIIVLDTIVFGKLLCFTLSVDLEHLQ